MGSLLKIKENSFDYSKSYYLNIHFSSRFYITDIVTNHPQLKSFKKENIFPKTLYRILNSEKHKSLLNLYYRLKYTTPSKTQEIHLQLNSSNIIGRGNLKVLATGRLYCLELRLRKIRNADSILEQYQGIPLHEKELGFNLYDDIYAIPFEEPLKFDTIQEPYRYAKNSLFRIFKEVIGIYPATVWMDRKLISFKIHLLTSQENISQIYWQYGFPNQRNLNRNFKKIFEISPSEFREKHKRI